MMMVTMKIWSLIVVAQHAVAFAPQKMIWLERTQRPANIVLRDIDVNAVTNAVSIDQTPQQVTPPPPTSPPAEKPTVDSLSLPAISEAPKASSSSVSMPSLPDAGGVDLPLPAIGAGLVAVFAAATFAMRGSVDEREEGSSPSTPAASPSPDDISIPYDAAARLAYEKSDKSMNYNAFQKKYEADAIADVIAKKK